VAIVALNVGLICYFRKRKNKKEKINPLDPDNNNNKKDESSYKKTSKYNLIRVIIISCL
jgi:hypothetical protein